MPSPGRTSELLYGQKKQELVDELLEAVLKLQVALHADDFIAARAQTLAMRSVLIGISRLVAERSRALPRR